MPLTVLPVQLSQVWLAIEAASVQEILGRRQWTPIPGAPSRLPGILGWRGRAVGVLDLASCLGRGALEPGAPLERTLVVQIGTSSVAIPVEAVREVHELSDDKVRGLTAGQQAYATSQVELDGVPVPVVDLPGLVAGLNASHNLTSHR
jgi:chemotaxis signal transduction protein